MKTNFLHALQLGEKEVVSVIGAGGKTSLVFRLAREARELGLKVLVTTSTRMRLPLPGQCDQLELSGEFFARQAVERPGIYMAGKPAGTDKISSGDEETLQAQRQRFDLVLIEADGAAEKPLKAWKKTEPVIFAATTVTIGVVDLQTPGATITDQLIHRLELFTSLTGASAGEILTLRHLEQMILHREGLFARAKGRRQLLFNKVETPDQLQQARVLRTMVCPIPAVIASLKDGEIHG